MANQDQAQILTGAFEKLSTAPHLNSITKIVAEAARALTGADGTTFVLKEDDRCYYADEYAISPLWKGKKFPMEACISGWSMIHGQVVTIKDIYQDSRIPHDAYRPTFVRSLCMTPIRPGNALGAIGSYWAQEHVPSDNDIKVLQVLANSTAIALENLDLKRVVITQNSKSVELKQQAKELEAAMYTLGHDLRTPIGGMVGIAELLRIRLGKQVSREDAEFIQLIIDTGKRASDQIERMLSLYRATNGQIDKKKVDVTQIAKTALKEVTLSYPNRPVRANIESNLTTFADQNLIHMVMENLLSNALKYSSRKPESKIEVGSMNEGSSLTTFFVRDNGDGFDTTDAHKLFKPLGRLHDEDEFTGTGLGLASVAKIIELHGGQVRAEGKKSEGATFFFSLPKQ